MLDSLFYLAVFALLGGGSLMLALVLRAGHRGELRGDLAVGAYAGAILTFVIFIAWTGGWHLISATGGWHLAPAAPATGGWHLLRGVILMLITMAGTVAGAVAISVFWVGRPLALLSFAWRGLPLPLLAVLASAGLGQRWPVLVLCAVLVLALGLVLVLAPLSPRPGRRTFAAAAAGDLTLLSWNIGQGPPDHGPSWRRQLTHVARVIRDSDADVACLQEVRDADHLDLLLTGLGPGWRGRLSNTDRTKVNAVLTRLNGELVQPTFDMDFRGPAAVDLRGLRILSVHLPTHQARLRAAYVDWLAAHARASELPVLMAGDFNMDPEGHWDQHTALFTDSLELDRRSMERLRGLGQDLGVGTAATAMPSRRLDRVIAAPELQAVELEVLHGAARGLMDHQPVVARLRRGR